MTGKPRDPPADKFLDVDTLPLFDMPEGGAGHATETAQKSPKSVEFGVCPGHYSPGVRTGLVRQGPHVAWRMHYVRSALGSSVRPCGACGVTLCAAAARHDETWPPPSCPCGKG